VLTYLLWRLHAPYALFAIAGVAAAAAPAWCADLVPGARPRPSATPATEVSRGAGTHGRGGLRPVVRANARTFLFGSLALLLAGGLAPFLIGALLTTKDVASYTIAARLTVVVTLLPAALTPWLWNRQARLRASERTGRHLESLRTVLLASLGCGLVLALAFAIVGPQLGHLLGAADVPAPRALYLAFACHGLVQFAQAPLSASLTGPRGARFMNISTACASVAAVALAAPLTLAVGVSGPVWALAGCYTVMVGVWWVSIKRRDGYLEDAHPTA
jgi:O-antigen/teichoic acid export membrane protein